MELRTLLGILLPLGGFFLLPPMMAYLFTVGLRRFDGLMELPEDRAGFSLSKLSGERGWAEENNFDFIGCYIREGERDGRSIVAWRHRERPTFFYTIGSERHLTTLFAEGASLTTATSTLTLGLHSPPWAYNQDYSEKPAEELWERHLEGENYLMDRGGAELIESDVWFEEWLTESSGEQTAYMRSLSFWPFRVYGWLFRSLRMNGVSIRQ